MENKRFLDLLAADADRLVQAAARGLDAAVPSCPGWTVADVVRHTGSVYRHKTAVMRLDRPPGEGEWEQGPTGDADLLGWFRASCDELLGELTRREPSAPTWTWWPPDQTVGFWCRRMAQETAVHRVDVESAFDDVTPVDEELAIDGVDEVLERFLGGSWSEAPQPAATGATIAVRTGGHIWRVTLRTDSVDVSRKPGDYDALISGEPSELLLYLWGRRPESAVLAEGDPEVLRELRDRLVLATQ